MKTSSKTHGTDSNLEAPKLEAPKHAFMAMTGVLIAIICSLVLLRDLTPANDGHADFQVAGKSSVTSRDVVSAGHAVFSILK